MDGKNNTSWIGKNDDDDDVTDSSFNGSMIEDSPCSSFSLSEMGDEDDDEEESTSSNSNLSSSSSLNLNGSLYELSELLKHLPIKRGLSMFYQGKAQSFTSLARVKSIEDLAKKNKPNYRSKVKSCKNFGLCTTKATITKKSSRRTSFSIIVSKKKSFHGESS